MGSKLVNLIGELTEETLLVFSEAFYKADAKNNPVTIHIHSCGGNVDVGIAIYGLLRTSRNLIRTIGIGDVSSMAALVLMGGDHRSMVEGATMLLHDGSVVIRDSLLKANTAMAEQMRTHEWYCQQIASRSCLRLGKVLSLASKETYLTAEEALELNIIDEIKHYRPLKGQRRKK